MRRRIDYMLSSKDEVLGTLFRFVVQHAGDLPTVSWILHGGEGEVYQAVLMMTNITNQYIDLWYVEVAQAAKDNVHDCFLQPARRHAATQELSFDCNTTSEEA